MEDGEVLVFTSPPDARGQQKRPVMGVRGPLDWSYEISNLLPLTQYKIRLSLKAKRVNLSCESGVFVVIIVLYTSVDFECDTSCGLAGRCWSVFHHSEWNVMESLYGLTKSCYCCKKKVSEDMGHARVELWAMSSASGKLIIGIDLVSSCGWWCGVCQMSLEGNRSFQWNTLIVLLHYWAGD